MACFIDDDDCGKLVWALEDKGSKWHKKHRKNNKDSRELLQ